MTIKKLNIILMYFFLWILRKHISVNRGHSLTLTVSHNINAFILFLWFWSASFLFELFIFFVSLFLFFSFIQTYLPFFITDKLSSLMCISFDHIGIVTFRYIKDSFIIWSYFYLCYIIRTFGFGNWYPSFWIGYARTQIK